MKLKIIPLTALAALVASSSLQAQTPAFSKPSGYVTESLQQGFNLIGLTLHSSPIATGTISTVTPNSVTVSSSITPTAGAFYILELNSGAAAGGIQEVPASAISGSDITVTQDLSAMGVVAGDAFTLRKAPTLEEVFGTTNSVLKKAATPGVADLVWLPNGTGGYDRYFLNTLNAWRNAAGGAAPNTPIVYVDGFFVQRKDAAVNLVITGQVKTTPTMISITPGFNLVGTSYPVGTTLQNSGLDVIMKKAATPGVADLVWVPNGSGGYDRYFLNTLNAWRNAAGGAAPADVPLKSAIFLQRKDVATSLDLTPPSSYNSL